MRHARTAPDQTAGTLTRRNVLRTLGTASSLLLAPRLLAQEEAPRDFSPGAPPLPYPDPDVIAIDRSFNALRQFNAPIQRLYTGALWSEGPAWSSQGRYFVWSDIPNNRQLRWLEDDGRVTVFRAPSNNSNGNTFDFQGRQITCEHLTRRVVRYELDGSVTVLADAFEGAPLNSPNDVVPHPDGSYWFTDPPFGGVLYEGTPDAAGGPSNPDGVLNSRVGQAAGIGSAQRQLPNNVYRVDERGRIALAIAADALPGAPNGLAFSPDERTLYVTQSDPARAVLMAYPVNADGTLGAGRVFFDATPMVKEKKPGLPDGLKVDTKGNVWTTGPGGVLILSPEGAHLGTIDTGVPTANVAFGDDGSVLYITANTAVFRVKTKTTAKMP